MRLATPRRTRFSHHLGINIALSVASFSLGMVVSHSPLSLASGLSERALMSGAVVTAASATEVPAAPEVAPSSAAPEQAPPVAESMRGAESKDAEPKPTWAQVAGKAQSWTAAVRADLNYGAGIVVTHSGLIVTNLHVVSNAHQITVTPFGGAATSARVLDTDAELDLALLSIDAPSPLPAAAELGSAAALAVGDEVLAVGSPRKMFFSASRGMVSFPNRTLEGVEYVQTDLPINEGNSGGPLVDREGHVVGVVSFILRESQGLSFALPIDRVITRFSTYLSDEKPAGVAVQSKPSAGKARELPARELPAKRAR